MKKILPSITGWRRWLLEIALILLIFFGLRLYQQQDIYRGPVLPLEGVLLDQSSFNLQQLRGKPFLLHFWATWCPICNIEQGSIASLAADYPLITVASWSDDVASYMAEKGLSYPVIDDPDGEHASNYGIKGVPASFFVDAAGQVRFVEVGYTSELGFRLRLWWLEHDPFN